MASFTLPVLLTVSLAAAWSLGATSRPAAPEQAGPPANLAELWVEPEPDRDLFYGVGGRRLAPDPSQRYAVIELKIRGASDGYTVEDDAEREWSVKFPPEAFMEIVASRLHWAVGFHQPPIYLLREWQAGGATAPNPQLPARFREKRPDLHGLQAGDGWSFKDNPFVGTRQLAGLLVLQAIIGNPDIKTSNNTIYTLRAPAHGVSRWYVVRDLGYSFGRAGFNAPRGDIDAFERAPFIRGVVNGKVRFHYGGLYKSLLADITIADVVWICERLAKLTDRQWSDAFRAGGYDMAASDRYIVTLKRRVAQGLALPR
jgi:hypothetical protein